jgi:hypothetical protein
MDRVAKAEQSWLAAEEKQARDQGFEMLNKIRRSRHTPIKV